MSSSLALDPVRTEQDRYRVLFETMPYPAWVYHAESLRFLEVNEAAVAHYGYTREEFLGMRISDIRPPGDIAELMTHVGVLAGTPDPDRIWRHWRKDGTLIEVQAAGHPVSFVGAPARFVVIRDVTAINRATRELHEQHRRLEVLHQVDRGIISARSPEEIAQAALAHIRELVPCHGAGLFLLDGASEKATVFALDAESPDVPLVGSVVSLAGVADTLALLESGRAYLAQDGERPEAPALREGDARVPMGSVLAVPLTVQGRLIGALTLGARPTRAFSERHVEIVTEVADQLAIAVRQAELREAELRGAQELVEANRSRQELLARLVGAQETERRRIAVDIHDDTIQVMTAAALRLDLLSMKHPELQGAEDLEKTKGSVARAIGRLRRLMFELTPPTLDREGLLPALRELLGRLGEEDAETSYTLEGAVSRDLPQETRTVVFRIAQEALANVRKHAGASRVTVHLEEQAGGIRCHVADDGCGFTLPRARSPVPGHIGLGAMRERAQMAGGWIRVDSEPGNGTTVSFLVPITPERPLPVEAAEEA